MLDPDLVLDKVVSAFRSIAPLVSEMADNPLNIYGYTYLYGADRSLALAISQQTSPSILIAYNDYLGGQWNGMTVWKHRLDAYIRPKNAATGSVNGSRAASPQHLFWLMMNSPVLGGAQNFRYTELMPGLMLADAMPSLTHQVDEQGADLFLCRMTLPEHGDQ